MGEIFHRDMKVEYLKEQVGKKLSLKLVMISYKQRKLVQIRSKF